MTTAIISGITGQDGLYLTELLLSKNYRVLGIVRDKKKALDKLPLTIKDQVELVVWDMMSQERLVEILAKYQPNEVYNFAAFSTGVGMFNDPIRIGEINGIAVTRILEAIREVNSIIRFCQASSSEMFGEVVQSPQNERTPFIPRSPYGAAKLYGHTMIRIYRKYYGLFACSAILFNHESPRRGLRFVTRKITHEVAKIKLGLSNELYLGNIDAKRDWGYAGDFVEAMWLMMKQDNADDYVIATGKTHTVRELCEIAFEYVGLDYQDYVRVDEGMYRSAEEAQLVGDAKKAQRDLGWVPRTEIREIIRMMVDADLKLLEGDI